MFLTWDSIVTKMYGRISSNIPVKTMSSLFYVSVSSWKAFAVICIGNTKDYILYLS